VFEEYEELKGKARVQLTPRENFAELSAKEIDFDFLVEIKPSVREKDPFDGYVYITVPGKPEDSYFFAQMLAHALTEHLAFFYEDFKISWGMISGERIPENDEEVEVIGEAKYWMQINVQEVSLPLKFDRRVFSLLPLSRSFQRIIQQYNTARKSKNPIDRFLGMFKVLEVQFHAEKRKVREALLRNKDFRQLVVENIELKRDSGEFSRIREDELPGWVNALVEIRDKCAHLKNQFGYAPYDPGVDEEVKPYGETIQEIARVSLMERYRKSNPNLFDSIFGGHSEGNET
jgi:hypothetical protein